MLDRGSPSLLNESPVFLALHDACCDLARFDEARRAIARGIPGLAKRLAGLAGTPYAQMFLTQLASNSRLLAAAEAYGLVAPEVQAIVERELAVPAAEPPPP